MQVYAMRRCIQYALQFTRSKLTGSAAPGEISTGPSNLLFLGIHLLLQAFSLVHCVWLLETVALGSPRSPLLQWCGMLWNCFALRNCCGSCCPSNSFARIHPLLAEPDLWHCLARRRHNSLSSLSSLSAAHFGCPLQSLADAFAAWI